MTVFSVPPVVQLWQSLCNSRPLPPHDWPCCHIQCGDYGKSLRAPPCFCVHPVWNITTRQRDTHTRLTHTLQKIKTRGCSSRWFLFMCLFINWFSFLSCYLAHPAGAEQHCKEKKKNPACWKWLRQLNVTPCKLTSCNINLTRVSSWNENEWLLQRFWKTFASLHNKRTFSCSSYITRLAAEWVGSSSLFLLFFIPPHSAKPNLMKGWSWIVNVCF